jgi:hypothetical protein
VNHTPRLAGLAVCAVAGLGLVGAAALRPTVLEEVGLDFWDWPRQRQVLDAETERNAELTRGWENALLRDQAKDAICRDLIADRITLADAVRRFREFQLPDYMWESLRVGYEGATDEERLNRHVIAWSCDLLRKEPDRADALRQRLQREGSASRDSHSAIR